MLLYKEPVKAEKTLTFKELFERVKEIASKGIDKEHKTKIKIDFPIIGKSTKEVRKLLGGMVYGSSNYFNYSSLSLSLENANGEKIAHTGLNPISGTRYFFNPNAIVPLSVAQKVTVSAQYTAHNLI